MLVAQHVDQHVTLMRLTAFRSDQIRYKLPMPQIQFMHTKSDHSHWASLSMQEVSGAKFAAANQEDMRYLFAYLEVCLGKIVEDNELGALSQALAGGYVEPGPGGDPIRWASTEHLQSAKGCVYSRHMLPGPKEFK